MKKNFIVKISSYLVLLFALHLAQAGQMDQLYNKRFYGGLITGFGATTWGELVCSSTDVSCVNSSVMPQNVKESGFLWGLQGGYSFNQYFALQLQYMRFKDASFDLTQGNPYNLPDYLPVTVTTKTSLYSLIAKLFIPLSNTIPLRAFSDFGVADVLRNDVFAQTTHHAGATFGASINYMFNEHWMAEAAFDYTTGYGKSESEPVWDYIPFTYATTVKVSYVF